MFQSLVFVSKTVPSQNEIHCLVAWLTNKQDIPVKISRNGKVVQVISKTGTVEGKTVLLDTNIFEFKRKNFVELYDAEEGDIATISVHLCYTINKTIKQGERPKTVTPLDHYGKIKPEFEIHFLSYLEKQTGLTGLVNKSFNVNYLPDPMIKKEEMVTDKREGRVAFVGGVNISITAKVGNPAVFNDLAGVAIGNRRSYGFGAVSCDDLTKARTYIENSEKVELA